MMATAASCLAIRALMARMHPCLSAVDERAVAAAAGQACNPSQLAAIQAAASRQLTLIHGPPGTGKVSACTSGLPLQVLRRACATSPTFA